MVKLQLFAGAIMMGIVDGEKENLKISIWRGLRQTSLNL
ncbi:hypothetical protein Desti_3280 [Desulfomonile tiedjei DSM 6799]|uniref:Uncharacterized protein n=1 Tax=Desulfomonile tiedjei (strain ATCC 49306 / DSM 6799 / DCB-1) TaxID=706587 RepID=I4C8P7_DESTA|nr:hypothetical protein Desti_3280 [Desulfomonile tiedjei DSM 6799]